MDHFICKHGNYGECEMCGDIKPLSDHAVLYDSLPDDTEIEQVACDESQQDWMQLDYMDIYREAFKDGAKWMKGKLAKQLK